jgi:hypothetical protein
MQRQFTSRLARRQSKKIARQSMLMIGLAIAGLLLFIFIIMPQAIQLFFRIFGSGNLDFVQADSVPPQVPVLSLLPEATKESTLELKGYGEAGSDVVVVRNGEEVGRSEVNSEGQFTYNLELIDGDNLMGIYGIDDADNQSTSRSFLIVRDTEAPMLAFEDLEDDRQILLRENQNLQIRGETEPDSQLTLNDRSVYVKSDGTFSTSFYLNEGDNQLKFVVTDLAGNRTEREVRVNFKY